jgi:stearoyl-CoA desaturase (delta-9 desaturase)
MEDPDSARSPNTLHKYDDSSIISEHLTIKMMNPSNTADHAMHGETLIQQEVSQAVKTPNWKVKHVQHAHVLGRSIQQQSINWLVFGFMLLFHVAAIAALFCFSWSALAVAVVLYVVAINIGIGMGYHRLLTHRGYKVPKWLEYVLAVCATLSLEGGPLVWVATHRVHHQHTDAPGDPHTPHEGGWWAHAGWVIYGTGATSEPALLAKYAPDLAKDRFHVWLTRFHWVPLTVLALILLAIGGWSWVLWGIFLRVTVGLHATWLVNSATHMWGSKRFSTNDDSRNNWWVALLTGGEGWHNNHHAHPVSARHGLAWYEFDVNYYGIWLLSKIGLAKKVQVARLPTPTISLL